VWKGGGEGRTGEVRNGKGKGWEWKGKGWRKGKKEGLRKF